MVMVSLGGLCLHGMNGGKREHGARRLAAITHGIGMVLVLIAGFGLLARLGIGQWPGWVYMKLLIWLALGLIMAPVLRKPLMGRVWWTAVIVLGGLAAYFAVVKPF